MKNDIKKEILENSFNYTNKIDNGNGDNKNLDLNNKNISSSKNKYVSQKFLGKIMEKENLNNIVNQVNNYNKFHNSIKYMNSIYKEILLQIKIKLLLNGKSMELRNISESIFNSSPDIKENICSEKNMSEIICKCCEMFKEFISLKIHSSLGPVVVLENSNYVIPENISLD